MGFPCLRRAAGAVAAVVACLSIVGCSSHERVETALASAAFVNTSTAREITVPWASPQQYTITPVRQQPLSPAFRQSSYLPPRAMTQLSKTSPANNLTNMSSSALTPPGELRVMSFNLRVPFLLDGTNHWGFRKKNVVKTIKEFQPDLLGTQECVAEQADFLQANLPDYGFRGVGRNDGARGGEMTAVLYRRDKFKELDHGYFWLSERPTVPGSKSWGAWFTRMCTWVKLQPLDGGAAFCVFNAHLDHMSGRARVESARLMREMIATHASGMPVIVTGDFNADAGSEPYKMLLAGDILGMPQLLFDAFRLANPRLTNDEGTRHDFNGKRGGDRIDWVLCNTGFTPVTAEINRTRGLMGYPSDHYPVQVIFRHAGQQKPPIRVAGLE